VNLRHSFFTPEMLKRSLEVASVVKFNSEELSTAAEMLGLQAEDEEGLCWRLLESYGLDLVAVTRGEKGSLLFTKGLAVEHPGYRVEVADTIGCGDAFAATLAHCLLRRLSLEATSEAANRMGAWVATQAGATPAATPQTIANILRGPVVF
jgi:fructokinase